MHTVPQPESITYSTVQYSTIQYSTAQYSTVQYSTAQHSTAQHGTARHSTAHALKLSLSLTHALSLSPSSLSLPSLSFNYSIALSVSQSILKPSSTSYFLPSIPWQNTSIGPPRFFVPSDLSSQSFSFHLCRLYVRVRIHSLKIIDN